MKLCGATALLDGKKKNKDNEALWSHSIVGREEKNEHNEALWCHSIVGWEEK